MLESAIIRKQSQGTLAADPGLLAETLLFYGKVHIIANRGPLGALLQSIGPDIIIELIDAGELSITFIQNVPAVFNNTLNGITSHKLTFLRIAAAEGRKLSPSDEIRQIFDRALGKSRQTRRAAERLIPKIAKRQSLLPCDDQDILDQTGSDIRNKAFVRRAVYEAISAEAPEYEFPPDWEFELFIGDNEFFIHTNINWADVNASYNKRIPPEHSELTPSYVINFLLDAEIELRVAAGYAADMVTTEAISRIMQIKMKDILRSRQRSSEQIDLFTTTQLDGAFSIREAINSGERSFSEFMTILKKARRFKSWLRSVNPDSNLLDQYYRASTANSWIQSLPGKILRFTGVSAIDAMAGGGTGIIAGAADSFVLEKLLGGWRPCHFVNGPLKRFVHG